MSYYRDACSMLIFNICFCFQFEIIFAAKFQRVSNSEELDCRGLIQIIMPTDFNLDFGIHERIKKEKKHQ